MSDKEGNVRALEFGPWTIRTEKSHILESECKSDVCNKLQSGNVSMCTVCRYEKELELPHLPEMVFPYNTLTLTHYNGNGICFNAFDALNLVDAHQDTLKVAVAREWSEARSDTINMKSNVKPFDWTFTTDYKGTLLDDRLMKEEVTDEKIDLEKLKVKEKILFYEEIPLFEDELGDNGSACLSVKIRVMPSGFFILMRFYLRVDNVLIRIHDTRVYHDVQKDYIIREYSTRQSNVRDLKVPQALWLNPQDIWEHLPVTSEVIHKLKLSGS